LIDQPVYDVVQFSITLFVRACGLLRFAGRPPGYAMSFTVNSWWTFLCAVAGLNILAWSLSALVLIRGHGAIDSIGSHSARRQQLLLSAAYVLGCAYRCALPVFDIPRIVLVDSWLSSVVVGRSVATVAELCFAGQWALILRQSARATGSSVVKVVSLILVPLIAIAEACSWFAVLTTANLAHVAENSIWGLSAALVVISLWVGGLHSPTSRRPLLVAWCLTGAAYVFFIFWFDVPVYWSRWMADEASGRHFLSIVQGLHDASERRIVSFRWEDWKSEVAWMSLYFSVGVWISISLIHATPPGVPVAADGAGADPDGRSRHAV
jgi:hypothetical protein